ncbi:complex I subunit 4 family protein [Puia dinghuensis]|uniref:NADH:ubiquinone oxidoreductase subunit M n=1 Tax=Puia dinghuensis TaxID=1792502 RepID=A0A8J2UHN3_9BACT|nr:NADH-quinone oxidoreductase subunit M [Puia dinghuensis]GGB18975.1 NADH:ubiquinone oxidoreductase subunit M [Puia dinghuensis]
MIPVLLIVIPLVSGLLGFFLRSEKTARGWALLSSLVTLAVTLWGVGVDKTSPLLQANVEWLPDLGSRFAVGLDGLSLILSLLTAVSFPLIFIATWRDQYKRAWNFYALMLLSQAGLLGVFVATDALLFYFFWELALIPVYFLCSQWGGERRIAATFKFFVYTFVGSLLMLVGIIWLYFHTPDHSFSMESFYKLRSTISNSDQTWVFWLLFVAFAIKMPIWPLHTWQPDTYEQSPTATTMVLSAIMVKMGVFGVIRWLAPVLPIGTWAWGDTVSVACIIGMVYASLIAMKQDDLKRLVAYSSIAHVGLMALAIFATDQSGMQGVMIQMFNHGINILGMWIVVDLIERQFGTRKISQLGGLATKAPGLAILLVIVALANVALPLTNAFVGEFLLFSGVFTSTATQYNVVFTAVAMLSVILSAVYTLKMIQGVFYGKTNALTEKAVDIRLNEKVALGVIVVMIVFIGVYPKPVLELTKDAADFILTKMNYK